MSSDEAEKQNVEEPPKEAVSSAEENEEKEEEKPKEEKVNNKTAAKKKNADPPKIKQPAKKRVKSDQEEKETKKVEKKVNKKKAAEKEEEEEVEESEDENDENHKPVPLLDQPLEISGKRKTKEVQRFKPPEPEDDKGAVKIPDGKGKPLGEIERIEFNIQRAKLEDLKILYRLCFGKTGKAANMKKFLKKFNGFEYEVASEELKKRKEYADKSLKKVKVAHWKNLCNILDIERGGTRDAIVDRLLEFLMNPVDSGKKLPGGGRSKRKGASDKNYEEGEESHRSKKKTKAKSKEAESEDSEKEDEEEQDEVEEEEKEEVKEKVKEKEGGKKKKEAIVEESEEEKEEKVKPKKGAKRGKKAAEAADKKAPPKKRAAAKKAAEKKSDSEADAESENDSENEEPASKKGKTPPTDEDIKTYVRSLLDGANLELITMKKVCQDVYEHYPDFDLAHKKDFIKTTVKNLISS